MNIDKLFNVSDLNKYVVEGWISARRHPHLPLVIYNYTTKTQIKKFWNDVTKRCRGLIVDYNGDVVGNCLPKFFNWNDENQQINTAGPVQVTDKLDGSYLSISLYKGQLITATRGSFESQQALVAQEILAEHPEYQNMLKLLCRESTAIFELIYPQNRVVLDYGALRDIILIGTIANFELHGGKQLWTSARFLNWPGQTVKDFPAQSFEEALTIEPRKNAEGLVVYFEDTGDRIKIKQEDYLRLHKIITNCTARNIWEYMAVNATKHLISEEKHWGSYLHINWQNAKRILDHGENWKDDFLSKVPDEFYAWVNKKIRQFELERTKLENEVRMEFKRLWTNAGEDRKAFALSAKGHPYWDLMFNLLDNKTIEIDLWRKIRPAHETPFMDSCEDLE